MKHRKWIQTALLMLAALLLFQQPVRAAGSVDLTETTELTITAQYGGVPLKGVQFELYLVSVMDASGALTLEEAFRAYADELSIAGRDDAAWRTLAAKLDRALLLGTLGTVKAVDTALADADGSAHFPNESSRLQMGLYLVPGTHTAIDGYVYRTDPFFVLLPEQDMGTNTWRYAVTARAKPDRELEQTDIKVIKVWQDDCHADERPDAITIQLMCDGRAYGDPITLPQNGRWSYTWRGLSSDHAWTVTETTVSGYRDPDIRREGNTFVVTNICGKTTPEAPASPSLPQTGVLWWPAALLLTAGACFLLAARRTKRRSE